MEKLNIALLGFGTVGKGVWDLLQMNKDEVRRGCARDIEITRVLVPDVQKDRGRDISAVSTSCYDDILNDESIDIVVELSGRDKEAFDYMQKALLAGKHVVTANKHVIAHGGLALYELAEKQSKCMGIEACVCGAIPVISTLTKSLAANKITEICGIMNGTTNFILTKMAENGKNYADVLKEAQDLGYAEADPSADVLGYDARNKLAILASLAFGTYFDVDSISTVGIDKIVLGDFNAAKSEGCTIKLIARAKRTEDGVELGVSPIWVKKDHPFYSVNNADNAVLLKGNCCEDITLVGRGAGSLPTASAVVADIMDIARCKGVPEQSFYSLLNTDLMQLNYDLNGNKTL